MKNLHKCIAPVCAMPNCTTPVGYHAQLIDKDGNVSYKFRAFCNYHTRHVVGKQAMKAFKMRKGGCENVDGRCGFVCDAPNQPWHALEIDHWDGDRYNVEEDNLVVLCACCHKKKTYLVGDHLKKKYEKGSNSLYDSKLHEFFIIE